jgi:hypothetical protein
MTNSVHIPNGMLIYSLTTLHSIQWLEVGGRGFDSAWEYGTQGPYPPPPTHTHTRAQQQQQTLIAIAV